MTTRSRGAWDLKAALIPGAFVYGHVSRVAIEAWGADWARYGSMSAPLQEARLQRRPHHHRIVCTAGEAGARRSSVTAENEDGVIVAVGWLGEPNPPASPPALADLPVMPTPEPLIPVAAGLMTVGTHGRSSMAILTPEDSRFRSMTSRSAIPSMPIRFVHSGS